MAESAYEIIVSCTLPFRSLSASTARELLGLSDSSPLSFSSLVPSRRDSFAELRIDTGVHLFLFGWRMQVPQRRRAHNHPIV